MTDGWHTEARDSFIESRRLERVRNRHEASRKAVEDELWAETVEPWMQSQAETTDTDDADAVSRAKRVQLEPITFTDDDLKDF